MLIWPTAHRVGASERAVAEALEAVPAGIALVGVRLPVSGGREIDVLVIEPRGVTTIEAKGTRMRGAVQPSPNGDWLIGGAVADFAGRATNPVAQAGTQAHRLRALCEAEGLDIGFVPALVVVCGDVTCGAAVVTGGVWASDLAHLPDALARLRRGRPLGRAAVRSILGVLGLGTRLPDDTALDAAGFPRDDGSMAPVAPAPWSAARPAAPAAGAAPPPPMPAYAPPPAAYVPPPYYGPPPPYGYYVPPPPPRRSRARSAPAYGPPNPMQQWPSYRAPRDPHERYRRRSGLRRSVRTMLAVVVLGVFVTSLAANGREAPEEPTPTRRPPAVRQTPRR